MPTDGQTGDTTPDSHVECLVTTECKKPLLRQNALDESEYDSSEAGKSRNEYCEAGCNGAGNSGGATSGAECSGAYNSGVQSNGSGNIGGGNARTGNRNLHKHDTRSLKPYISTNSSNSTIYDCSNFEIPTLSSYSFSRSLTIQIDAASTGSSFSMLDISSFDTSSVDLASVGRQRPRLQIDLTRKKSKQSVSKRTRGIYLIEFFVTK